MDRITNIEELKDYFDTDNVVIYGAGKAARTIIKWALREKRNIKSVLVTSQGRNPKEILGIKVYSLENGYKVGDDKVLVATMEITQKKIENVLIGEEIDNYKGISDDIFYEIEREIADYDIEQTQLLEWLIQYCQEKKEKTYWHHDFEKRLTLENWGDVYERPDFKQRFLRLIAGLDEESVETVVRIINRQKRYIKSKDILIDFFTQHEKDELRKQDDEFWSQIIEISPDLFMYKKYFLTSRDFEPSVFYYKHGIGKVKNLSKLRGGTFLDVGGYVGDSAIVFQELEPSKIYTFEGVPEHCVMIEKNMKLNNIQNVVVENLALGDHTGIIKMEVCGSCSNTVGRKGINISDTLEVPLTTLDEYVEKECLEDIRLIKVDIEGSEPFFLKGARKTIEKYRPVILLSIYHNEHDFFELKPLLDSWALGYKFQIYKSINGNITNETMLIAEAD